MRIGADGRGKFVADVADVANVAVVALVSDTLLKIAYFHAQWRANSTWVAPMKKWNEHRE